VRLLQHTMVLLDLNPQANPSPALTSVKLPGGALGATEFVELSAQHSAGVPGVFSIPQAKLVPTLICKNSPAGDFAQKLGVPDVPTQNLAANPYCAGEAP
jgi:hypothetical protein